MKEWAFLVLYSSSSIVYNAEEIKLALMLRLYIYCFILFTELCSNGEFFWQKIEMQHIIERCYHFNAFVFVIS